MRPYVRLNLVDRLTVLRRLDRLRKWQSLDDRRFCRCCHKLISGRQIEVLDTAAEEERFELACPTTDCSSTIEDWVYPNEIAQPPDKWGRRVIRVLDREGERFVLCGKSQAYSRRRMSHPGVCGARMAV